MNRLITHALYKNHSVVQKTQFCRSVSTTPLTEPLAGFNPKHGAPSPYELNSSELGNGIRVVTYGTSDEGALMTSVGVGVQSGARWEDAGTAGGAFLAQRLGSTSTMLRSPLRVAREWELLPAQLRISAERETLFYDADLPRSQLPEALPLLADLLRPRLPAYEVRDVIPEAQKEAQEALRDPTTWLLDHLHATAYGHIGLGNSLAPTSLGHILPNLRRFYDEFLFGSRLTIVATGGVKHDEFVRIAQDVFGELPKGTPRSPPPSPYVGGQFYLPSEGPTYFGLGWEGPTLSGKDRAAALVLSLLLGDGRRATRSGPGWGAASVAQEWVTQTSSLTALRSVLLPYSDSGLWALLGKAQPGEGAAAVTAVVKGLRRVAAQPPPPQAVDRAVRQAVFSLLAVESRTALLQALGSAVGAGVAPTQAVPAGLVSAVEGVTGEGVQRVAARVLQSPLTVVAAGDVRGFPSAGALQTLLR